MKITFDPAKDVFNMAKHGVSLVLASELEWGCLLAKPDARRDYGELRGLYGSRRRAPHHQPQKSQPEEESTIVIRNGLKVHAVHL